MASLISGQTGNDAHPDRKIMVIAGVMNRMAASGFSGVYDHAAGRSILSRRHQFAPRLQRHVPVAGAIYIGQPLADGAAIDSKQVGGSLLGQPCRCKQGTEVCGSVARFGEVNHRRFPVLQEEQEHPAES